MLFEHIVEIASDMFQIHRFNCVKTYGNGLSVVVLVDSKLGILKHSMEYVSDFSLIATVTNFFDLIANEFEPVIDSQRVLHFPDGF